MIDYLRNLFISWFNKILNWFSERQNKEMNTKKEIPFDKNKHADDERQKNISERFQALDEGCKSIANLAEIEMSQTESKTFKDNEPKVNNDLDAPVPANQIRNTNLNGASAQRKDAMASNNNLEEYEMGLLQSKPKTKEDFDHAIQKKKDAIQKEKDELRDLEKGRDEFIEKNGIKPIQGEKIFNTSISSIKSMNEDNKLDSNEYKPFLKKPARSNNAKFNEIDKQFQQMENKLAESTNDMNKLKEQVNNHEEKINKNTEDIKKTQEEQIDIKKLLAKHDEMLAEMKEENKDSKIRIKKAEKMLEEMKEERKDTKRMLEKMDEDRKIEAEKWREHEAKWMEMFGPYLKKKPRSSRNDNRESTNTSFSSFRGYMNMNNSQIPRMERADMAHSHDENQ